MRLRWPLPAGLAAVTLLALAVPELLAQCSGVNRVAWPAGNPVWDFCFRRPSETTYLANGAGLEISDVKYRGVMILKQAHIPILNVKYEPGGCGGPSLCYRDWFDEERAFDCAPASSGGYCTGTATPAATVCQHPGTDSGGFLGVAVEDLGDRLKLTAQCEAGWYRYVPVWEFFPDGTLQARVDATSVDNGCVAITHSHHAYFRFDFDVNGSANNAVDLLLSGGAAQRVSMERSFSDSGSSRSRWRVGSPGSPFVAEVSRNPRDGAAGDPPGVPNDFPMADGWVLLYNANEISDGSSRFGACPAGLDAFVSGQDVDGANVVLWVRAGSLHEGEPGGITRDCAMVGPTIRVAETPSRFHSLAPCRVLDTRNAPGPFGGPALAAGVDRTFPLAGQCGIPETARAVSANVTVTRPAAQGHLEVAALGGAKPGTSVVNFGPGQTRANNAILRVGSSGAVLARAVMSAGDVHFLLDVNGYFE